MKRKGMIAGAICLALLAGVWVFGGSKRQVYLPPEKRITIIAPFSNDGYWGNACEGAIEEGERWGIDVKCLASVDNNEDKVIANLRSAIFSDVDGIVSYGVQGSEEFETALGEAKERKIPVVIFDSDVDTDQKLCYVGSDNYDSGWIAGEKMAEDCGERGNILAIVSSLEADNQKLRMKGFQDALEQYPDMEIVETLEGQSSVMLGQKLILDAFSRHTQIDGIYCAEGISTYSAYYVMRDRLDELRIPVIVYEYGELIGEAIEEGNISTAIVQKPEEMGQMAVRALGQYLENGIVPEENIYIETMLIGKDNLEEGENIAYRSERVQWHYY